ncbi:AraC family transcriptional regulator [Burkholderia stagnalis]|uniref:AraC family transcriptional regulator n=1 Tax=Burkholderia stagnalis TaxID=1503054 RepID=A0ABX9YH34_9BURK|nr:AraC family transcriptional regulator [Burkholderia stagnalis]KVN34822.1 AraC family transcriptional regulator [Burkholderia stagnalis]MDY7801412.1 AraC family transcriptional regulator ligand-binding domain-containing protein [Burkholderia stagnalis]RQQ44580.1 AraC family transcriptional regulator [Burkholderia stagnalis]RQQ58953.1 AraC family transcriptional regulator [Burkholderia stagnalis]RQQ62221.1 AraC family transcriptional regulator [Burkholderia stagnalis]
MNLSRQSPLTLSAHFLHGMLRVIRTRHGEDVAAKALASAAIPRSLLDQPDARMTREQYVALYRAVAARLDDEMLGLWSRPIRGGTLKYLMLSLLDAPTVLVAFNRFVRFWNLLLDDYRLLISTKNNLVRLALVERMSCTQVTPLGHELMMKLVHGIASWLLGREIILHRVEFGFARPRHVDDYAFLFPGAVHFDTRVTSIYFLYQDCAEPFKREKHELWAFLKRAPGDWTFSAFHRGSIVAKTREYLEQNIARAVTIQDLAEALHTSVRTLNRRFAEEGTHFQLVKDGLRRDIAVHRLTNSNTSVAVLAFDLGFSDATGFCRAFKHWTGSSPSDYRKGSRQGE